MLKATIEKVFNGFTVKTVDEYTDGTGQYEKTFVFEFPDNEDEEIHTFIDMVWFLREYFEMWNSKYSKHQLDMKCECKDNNNDIEVDTIPST